jgi:hypothetical protein
MPNAIQGLSLGKTSKATYVIKKSVNRTIIVMNFTIHPLYRVGLM